jgi:hypothetical protein
MNVKIGHLNKVFGGSIFYGFNRFIKLKRKFLIHALIAIGGSAGLAIHKF